MRFNDGEQLLDIFAKQFAFHHALASEHPVTVAFHGIDFAVVRHKSQRLSAVPAWERVGGKS